MIAAAAGRCSFRPPVAAEALQLLRSIGLSHMVPPAPPPQEHLPRWRRMIEGLRHCPERDGKVIQHHYDVSNRFYEMVLGPSMTYTCALFETEDATLEEAQHAQVRPRRPQARPPARASGCSTSAAAGAAWSATPPASTASARSA